MPVETERSIVKLNKKEYQKNRKMAKIAEAAAKQTGRGKIPQIGNVLSFEQALQYSKN